MVKAKQHLGEILSAFEFLDKDALELTLEEIEGAKAPVPNCVQPFHVILETSGSNAEHDAAKVRVRVLRKS